MPRRSRSAGGLLYWTITLAVGAEYFSKSGDNFELSANATVTIANKQQTTKNFFISGVPPVGRTHFTQTKLGEKSQRGIAQLDWQVTDRTASQRNQWVRLILPWQSG